jgi:flagellar hook-length control protein FliK
MESASIVANQSPPSVMTATKPTVKTSLATDQFSFDLALQEASSTINAKQSDASERNDSNSIKKNDGTDAIPNQTSTTIQQESEVTRQVKTTKEPKNKDKTKSKSDDTSEESETDSMDEAESAIVAMNVVPTEQQDSAIQVAEDIVSGEVIDVVAYDTPLETPVILPQNDQKIVVPEENLSANEISNSEPIAEFVLPDNEISNVSTEIETQNQTTDEDAEVANQEDDQLVSQLFKGKQFTQINETRTSQTTDTQPDQASSDDQKAGANSLPLKSNDFAQATPKVSTQTVEASTAKDTQSKITDVDVKTEAASPGTTYNNEAAVGINTATINVINEQARLAEAPKTEIVTQVTSQIDQMLKNNRSELRVQLYPEELGHIDLKIISTKDGIGVTMIADKASTQDALMSNMNNLKQNIEQAGIQLSNLNIGQGQNSNSQNSSDQQNSFAQFKSHEELNSDDTEYTGRRYAVQLETTVVDYRV